jgi:DNA replication protein DnaC
LERGEIKPTELAALASEMIRQLRSQGVEINLPETREARVQADAERRMRDEEALRKDAQERKQRMIAATLEHVLPKPVLDDVIAAVMSTHAAISATAWWRTVMRPVRGIILRGGVGVGKTVAAGMVVRLAVESGKRSVSWHRPNDFVSAVLHRYDDDAPELGRDLVVIDDMGRETKADFPEALCTFFDVHPARILITTNDPEGTSHARYDVRVRDRLQQQCMSIAVAGKSMRGWGGQ